MKIWIRNQQKHYPLDLRRIRRTAQKILGALESCDTELGILFVDDPAIQELNRRYLGRNRPTNVIAFPMREGEFSVLNPQLLGDVVISVDTASRQSELFGLTLEKTLILLLIHGILHLVGFDHERSKKEAREMTAKEKELLKLATRRGRSSLLSHEVSQKKKRGIDWAKGLEPFSLKKRPSSSI